MPATFRIALLVSAASMVAFLPTVARAQECTHGNEENTQQQERRLLALSVARFVNTVEVNHKKQFGEFLPFKDLPRSPIIEKINKEGSTYRAYKAMSFAPDSEVIPGFEGRFLLNDGGYSFSLADKTDGCRFTYFSDERGVIYEAVVIGSPAAVTK